eukprot:6214763-Pleurochrysis_carterae.AAC.4
MSDGRPRRPPRQSAGGRALGDGDAHAAHAHVGGRRAQSAACRARHARASRAAAQTADAAPLLDAHSVFVAADTRQPRRQAARAHAAQAGAADRAHLLLRRRRRARGARQTAALHLANAHALFERVDGVLP